MTITVTDEKNEPFQANMTEVFLLVLEIFKHLDIGIITVESTHGEKKRVNGTKLITKWLYQVIN